MIGKAIKGFRPIDSSERRCTECSDERKNQKIHGMTIMKNMKRNGDEWDGRKLVVRGFIGFSLLCRSQVWIRQSNNNE